MFSQACVRIQSTLYMHGKGGMCGRGTCMAWGACVAGGHAWQGGMHGRRQERLPLQQRVNAFLCHWKLLTKNRLLMTPDVLKFA